MFEFEPQTTLPEPPYARVPRESSEGPEHRSVPSASTVSVQFMRIGALCDNSVMSVD